MGFLFWIGIILLIWIISNIPLIFNAFCRVAIAGFVTPADHRRYGEYAESEAETSLSGQGFSISPRWSSNAVASIKTE